MSTTKASLGKVTEVCGALDSLTDYLGEVSYKMAAGIVSFSHHIEEEWLHIIVQRFVVQEEFGKQTQVLAINLQMENASVSVAGLLRGLTDSQFASFQIKSWWNVYLVLFAVHFKNRYSPFSVNLITWWMFPHTFGLIAIEIRERCV